MKKSAQWPYPCLQRTKTSIIFCRSGSFVEFLVEHFDVSRRLTHANESEKCLLRQWLHSQASDWGLCCEHHYPLTCPIISFLWHLLARIQRIRWNASLGLRASEQTASLLSSWNSSWSRLHLLVTAVMSEVFNHKTYRTEHGEIEHLPR